MLATTARVSLVITISLGYMMMMIPCKLAVIAYAFDKNEARLEA